MGKAFFITTPNRWFPVEHFVRRIGRTETFRAAALLLGVLHICFFPCILGNKNLLASSRDASSIMPWGAFAGPSAAYKFSRTLDNGGGGFISEPSLALLRYQYFHERVAPLWNPYQGFGCPLAAEQEMQPFYPLTLALITHLTPRTYNWFLLLRLFLAGMGAYLYLRFFVSFWPAVAGGVTSMLAGFYVLFINMPEISVELLVSISLLAAEYLLRLKSYWPVVAFSIMLLLVFLGGMPESALTLFVLLYSYVLFRIASDPELRSSWVRAISRLVAATCAGLALSAFFLLPFWELMHRSSDAHQPHNVGGLITGLVHDPLDLSVFTYFFPLLYGPPFSGVFQGINLGTRNYYGLLSTFLLVIAALAVFGKKRGHDRALRAITWFFLGFTLLLLLKRYGFPGINSLGRLPFFQLVNFPKYQEAEGSICVSILAAIGLERLLRGDVSRRAQAIVLGLIALLIPLAFVFSRDTIQHEISELHVKRIFPLMALGVPSILMIALAVVLIRFWPRRRVGAVIAIAAMVTAEMSLNFIAPTFYWSNKLPRISHDPFAGAPYVDFLKQRAGNDRIFARDGLLFPNWASAFQLYDIRYLDAMYDRKYFPFLRNFFQDQKNLSLQNDLGDRFNGAGAYDVTTPLVLRLLQLSSVKYIGTLRPFTTPNRMIDAALAENQGHILPEKEVNITRREFILDGQARDALGEQAPYSRLPYRIHVGNNAQEIFSFSYTVDPAAFDQTSGDGVEFIVETRDESGQIAKQFSQYIDPKHDPRARHWLNGQIDLSAYRGRTIELLFTTAPGPQGDISFDWAAWSNFHFVGQQAEADSHAPPFQLIYNAEAKIYRYDDVLPRAAIYEHADLVRNEGEALKRLADPALDIFKTVVLDESTLNSDQRAWISEINRQPAERVVAASIRSYTSQDIQVEASLDRPGILALNDTSYPGWNAEIDGQPTDWTNANYMFRAVLLPAGKHLVRFRYQPESFRLGVFVSGLALAGLIAGFLVTRARRRYAGASF